MPANMSTIIDELSGPDTNGQALNEKIPTVSNVLKSTNASMVSGSIPFAGLPSKSDTVASSMRTAATGLSGTGTDSSTSIGIGGIATTGIIGTTDPYYFYGSMSEDLLHKYLDKAIEATQLSSWRSDGGGAGPSYNPSYDSMSDQTSPAALRALYDPAFDHYQLIEKMIFGTGAKIVWDMFFYVNVNIWPPYGFDFGLQILKNDVKYIHAYDGDIICGASIAEDVMSHDTQVALPPTDVINIFYPFGRPIYSYYRPVGSIFTDPYYGHPPRSVVVPITVNSSHFDYRLMQSGPESADWTPGNNMDITFPEVQMWYYWLAVQYIEAGCEMIHFGDLFQAIKSDSHNKILWWLMSLIRSYAAAHARRGMVLLSTHVNVDPTAIYKTNTLDAWYYDPEPSNILPNWERQLIFDIHALGIYYRRNPSRACEGCYDLSGYGTAILPTYTAAGFGLLSRGLGGKSPQGWYCARNPVMLRFDQGDNADDAGCSCGVVAADYWLPDAWGFDNESWFAWNSESERQKILLYTYYIIKCLDPFAHFSPGARLILHKAPAPNYICYTEQDTIQAMWDGVYAEGSGWVLHNFNVENTAKNDDAPAVSSLVFASSYQLYFIGEDGYIHGYIKVRGDYCGGTWLTVSPSYAADVPAARQARAASSLVVSPDGTKLLYIGDDGYIHGLSIVDVWTYKYLDFFVPEMAFTFATAISDLIFADDNHIFFIGNLGEGPTAQHNVVLGYKVNWTSGSCTSNHPVISAYAYHLEHCDSDDCLANNGLVYEPNERRLYYVNLNGWVAIYEANATFTEFAWVSLASYQLSVTILGNIALHYDAVTNSTRLYFVALDSSTGLILVHGLLIEPGTVGILYPSWRASHSVGLYDQLQSDLSGEIAVSPDGSTIIYISRNMSGMYMIYLKFDGTNYTYAEVPYSNELATLSAGGILFDSLQFTSNTDVYFINFDIDSTLGYMRPNLNRFTWQEDYCSNSYIARYLYP
jgi:WD40-like Beta Propeller Repeat